MKFKLDENFGSRTQNLFRASGHVVSTVREESLLGSSDRTLYNVCCREHVCLVTLDLDFANAGQFPPEGCGGIAVIRLPHNPSLPLLESLISEMLAALAQMAVDRQLWIVEPGRIRVRQSEEDT